MRQIPLIAILFALFFCKSQNDTETEILNQLDLAFNGTPGTYFPQKKSNEFNIISF